eukprot:2355993-Rhodomonas_salina.3
MISDTDVSYPARKITTTCGEIHGAVNTHTIWNLDSPKHTTTPGTETFDAQLEVGSDLVDDLVLGELALLIRGAHQLAQHVDAVLTLPLLLLAPLRDQLANDWNQLLARRQPLRIIAAQRFDRRSRRAVPHRDEQVTRPVHVRVRLRSEPEHHPRRHDHRQLPDWLPAFQRRCEFMCPELQR